MSDLTTDDRIKLAVKFIEQSPPGEINDIINDIRAIISDDEALMPHVRPALRDYNLKQLHAVEHAAEDGAAAHVSLLSHAAIVPGEEEERYIDHDGKRSFVFDHVNLVPSDFQPYELPEAEETFRAELSKSLGAYASNHFPGGYWSVSTSQFPLLPPEPEPEPVAVAAVEVAEVVPASAEPVEEPAGGLGEEPATPVAEKPKEKLTADDEVDAPGGLANLDDEIEEVKAEEEIEAQLEKEEKADGEREEEKLVYAEEAASEKAFNEEVVEGNVPVEEFKEELATVAEDDAAEEKAEEEEAAEEAAEAAEPVAPAAAAATEPAKPVRKQERVENPTYTLEIVGNRFNPTNFWTGRWRTRWVVDTEGTVEGTINVDVHYYEQGNVQLATEHKASFPTPKEAVAGQSIASQIVTTISKIEAAYQFELNGVYANLNDKTFRLLRRALPVTRQKVDWDKVSGYTLGSDLSKAKA
ncbi:F-actin-capping protein subunit alpha [Vanrija pseudolonga]|uniref:F-actin-capping protein subunit alpha n=1 Tax=Vanrija pseudolonga TaxID=143232 RepID=A0AAF1BLX3_9TREE|nr:F-actin-capping protein subunit alpha [Vanrija pseudolonga]